MNVVNKKRQLSILAMELQDAAFERVYVGSPYHVFSTVLVLTSKLFDVLN